MTQTPIVTIFGGSGFVGRYVSQRMARAGYRVRVAVRRPNDAHFVRPYGTVGQVEPIQANIRDEASTRAAIEGASIVVNCVAIGFEDNQKRVEDTQTEGAERIARLSADLGVEQFVHISAIGADPESESYYARTKAEGEQAILQHFPSAAILRPSVIFGNEDKFFNRFANMARFSPVLPLVGAETKFQPVYVDDVAAAVEAAIAQKASGIFELGGPDVASFRALMEDMLVFVRRRKLILDIPMFAARIMAGVLDLVQFASGGLLPNKMITRDQVANLANDNIVTGDTKTFADLGIKPQAMDGILDSYLYSFRKYGQFTALTESAKNLKH